MQTSIELSEKDQATLQGEWGEGAALAQRILVRMAPLYGANRLLDISSAHIDSSVYMGPATLAFAERLAALGAKVSVPSTLNVAGIDEHGWSDWSVPEDWAAGSKRQMDAYRAMGCIETWTCAPYQTEHRPAFGDQIASGESNVIAFYNSVLGARTERYPDMLDICAAITGRAPASGLHLEENRRATVLFDLSSVPAQIQESEAFWPSLGNLIGTRAPDSVSAVAGLDVKATEDNLKALSAGVASYGAVALFHLVGITPEAPTLEAAFHGLAPETEYRIGAPEMRKARQGLSTVTSDHIDLLLLGSPHFSIGEFRRLATLASGRTSSESVRVLVTCSRTVRDIVQRMDIWPDLERFGVKLTVDSCPLVSPMLGSGRQHIITNSAKYAFYSPGLLNADVRYAPLQDCVESAVMGRAVISDEGWGT